jgi:hypothetical protein
VTRLKLLAVLAAMLLAGCATGTPGESPGQAASSGARDSGGQVLPADASALAPDGSSGPAQTLDRSATGGILPPDSLALVTVDGLHVRDKASLSGTLVGKLPKGTRVLVVGNPNALGPVTANGYDWYYILYRADQNDPSTEILGWAAAGDAQAPYLATLKARCAQAADVALTAWEQLACYGNGPQTFEGTYGCGGCGGFAPGSFEPAWLADPIAGGFQVLTVKPGKGLGRLDMHFPPDKGLADPVEGSILRVVGHYDDSAASTCRIAPGPDGAQVAADQRAALLFCRERFVVDSYEQIGTDPSYPAGG